MIKIENIKNLKSLIPILEDIRNRAMSKSNYEFSFACFNESLKTLISILKNLEDKK